MDDKKAASLIIRKQEIASRVRQVRRMKDLTQDQAAEMLGCSRRRYNLIEKGKLELSASELDFMARELKVPIIFFFDGEEERLFGNSVA